MACFYHQQNCHFWIFWFIKSIDFTLWVATIFSQCYCPDWYMSPSWGYLTKMDGWCSHDRPELFPARAYSYWLLTVEVIWWLSKFVSGQLGALLLQGVILGQELRPGGKKCKLSYWGDHDVTFQIGPIINFLPSLILSRLIEKSMICAVSLWGNDSTIEGW